MISDISPVNNYSGNGSATTFDFDFYIEDSSQLKVYKINSSGAIIQLSEDIDYSVNEFTEDVSRPNPDFSQGGYITFPLASSSYQVLASDEKISLQLDIPFEQESGFGNSSLLNLNSLEFSLDYLTRLCQILKRQVARCAKIKEAVDVDPDSLSENINLLAEIKNDISTVSNAIDDVIVTSSNTENISSVAGSIENVNAVADDLENIDAVNDNKTNIDTVADSISDVNTVAGSIQDVNTVAGSIADINDVADDLTNINSVAGDLSNIDSASDYADNAYVWAEGTDADVQDLGGVHSAKGWAEVAASGQIQADWNQSDNAKKDFIKNKPDLTVYATQTDLTNGLATKQDALSPGTDLEIVYTQHHNLPVGYTELESLQSTGTQYIDTGLKVNSNDWGFKAIVKPSNNSDMGAVGSIIPASNENRFFGIRTRDNSSFVYGFGGYFSASATQNYVNVKTTTELNYLDSLKAKIGNDSADLTRTNDIISGYNIRLFGISDSLTWSGAGYEFWITKGQNTIAHYIPAKRDSDNALGVYDLISDTFIAGSGTGTFIAGTEIIPCKINFTNTSGYTTNVGTVTSVNNTQPDANGDVTLTIPTVNDGILTITQNGTSKGTFSANQSTNDTIALTDTTYNAFTGADGTNAGSSGLVPAPSATDNDKYLKGDGTWASVSGGSSTDVQINGTSITSGGVANILTESAYSASNKIATMSDLPADEIFVATYGTTTFNEVWTAYDAGKTVFVKDDSTTVLGEVIAVLNYFEFNSALDAHFEFASSILNDGTYYTYTLDQDSYWNEYTEQIPDTSGFANTDLSNLTATGEAHFLKNTATGSNSLTIIGNATSGTQNVNIGKGSTISASGGGVAVGYDATIGQNATYSTAIGHGASVTAAGSIQLGGGINSTSQSLAVGFTVNQTTSTYQLLNGETGLIPDARLSTNIARTSQIPSTSGLANTSLSNLSSTGQKVIDGQWVAKETSLTTSTAINSYTLDLVNYLPSGGGKYEVLVACNITSNNTSPSNTRLYSDIISISTNYLNQKTPNTSHSLQAGCLLILPVTRYLYFKIENHATASTTIIAEGYRRIGTNT